MRKILVLNLATASYRGRISRINLVKIDIDYVLLS